MDDDLGHHQQQNYQHRVRRNIIFIRLLLSDLPLSQRCDENGDGKLDYQEFKSMIFRSKARKEENINEEEKDFKRKAKTIKKDVPKKGKKGKGSK